MAESAYPASLAEALALFQAEIPEVAKSEKAEVEGETKAGKKYTYSYTYADLAACTKVGMPLLGKHGLSFSSKPTWLSPEYDEQGKQLRPARFALVYTLRHVSGDSDGGEWPLPDPTQVKPTVVGSAITYAKRYSFCAVTGIAPAGDDDAAAADADKEPPSAAPADDRHAVEADPDTEANYDAAIAAADSLQTLQSVQKWIVGERRLDRAARQRLRDQYTRRLEELTAEVKKADEPSVDGAAQ